MVSRKGVLFWCRKKQRPPHTHTSWYLQPQAMHGKTRDTRLDTYGLCKDKVMGISKGNFYHLFSTVGERRVTCP